MIELRAASARDAVQLANIYAPYVVTNAVSFEDKAPDAAELKLRLAAHKGMYPWIVAAEEDVIVGYAYAKPLRQSPAYRFAVEIAVYTAGELEGKGVRKSLLNAILATLTEQNFTQAIVTLLTPNDKLIQLYEASGFRRAGQYREICFKNGQWNDVGLWQRELADAATPPEDLKSFKAVGVVKG